MSAQDLGLMFQNGMPSTGSFMMGQQQAMAQQQAAQDLRKMTLENDQSQVMNPLNAQFRQGQVDTQAAQLPGVMGQSQSQAAQGQIDTQTQAAHVAAKLSALSTSVGNDGMVRMGQDGEKLAHAAQIIKNYPPALQKQMFAQAVQQYGGDVNSPMFKGLLQAPDDQFQSSAEALGKGMSIAGQKYQQESLLQGQRQGSAEKIAAGNNTTQLEAARIMAQGRVDAAKMRGDAIVKTMGVDKAIAHYATIPDRTPEEEQIYQDLKAQQLQARAAGAQAVAPTVLGQKTPLQAAEDAARAKGTKTAAPAQLPSGYKQVGTSNGVPVYEGPDGKQYLWGK